MNNFSRVINSLKIPLGKNKAVDVNGRSILICHSAEGFFALANECSHQKQPLEGGRIRGKSIFCPVHGARFDLETGLPKGQLTTVPVATFSLRVVEGWIEIAGVE